MASPISLTTAAVLVVPFNAQRKTLMLQNTGAAVAYVKKQIPGVAASIPSATNYDFELTALGTESGILKIDSSAGFMAVGAAATTLAYMETVVRTVV
jgi:hypothetical protein